MSESQHTQDRYARIRAALAMEPTPGPWGLTELPRDMQRYGYKFSISRGGLGWWIAKVTHEANGGSGVANATYIAACDPDTIRDLLSERDALEAENERLHEQLRLATVDQATAEAEANDARAEIDALMDRTTRLTPNDAGYVVAHANEDGAHVDTAITLAQRVELEIEDRGHEMVLAERAKRHR